MANASAALTIAASPNHSGPPTFYPLTPALSPSSPAPAPPPSGRGGGRVPLSAVLTPASMFALGVLGNVVAIAALAQTPRDRKDGAFYALVCGLAVTDLLGTCLSSPVVIAGYVRGSWPGGDTLCGFFSFTLLFFGAAGISILCAMSVERYLAINHAYVYTRHVDARRARAALAALYAINAGLCALPSAGVGRSVAQFPGTWCFLDWRSHEPAHAAYNYVYAGYSAALIALTLFCNAAVCRALLRMRRRTSGCSARAATPLPPSSCSSACTAMSRLSPGASSSPSVTAFSVTVRLPGRDDDGGDGAGPPMVCQQRECGDAVDASPCHWPRSPLGSTLTPTCGGLTSTPTLTRPRAPGSQTPHPAASPPANPSSPGSLPDPVASPSLCRSTPLGRTLPGMPEPAEAQAMCGLDVDRAEYRRNGTKESVDECERGSTREVGEEKPGGSSPESSRRGRWHRRGLRSLGPSAAEVQMLWLLLVMTVVFLVCSLPLVVRIFVNQLHRPPVERRIPHNRDILAIRFASFNPILDPWVYILCRRGLPGRLARLCRRLVGRLAPPSRCRVCRGGPRGATAVPGDGDDGASDGEDRVPCGSALTQGDDSGCGCIEGGCATTTGRGGGGGAMALCQASVMQSDGGGGGDRACGCAGGNYTTSNTYGCKSARR